MGNKQSSIILRAYKQRGERVGSKYNKSLTLQINQLWNLSRQLLYIQSRISSYYVYSNTPVGYYATGMGVHFAATQHMFIYQSHHETFAITIDKDILIVAESDNKLVCFTDIIKELEQCLVEYSHKE